MTRYRACALGQPLAPWQATYDLAAQSAIEEGGARREPGTGRVYFSPGVEIEQNEGEVEMVGDMALLADALEIIRKHKHRAIQIAVQEIRTSGADIPRQARWVMVLRRIVQIMEAAAKDARQ